MKQFAWTRLYRCGASVVGVDPPAACPVHGEGKCPDKPGVHRMSHLDVEKADGPHIWIQWKGTDVCADIHCACGAFLHWDGDFMYFVKCPSCQRVWEVGTHVKLYEVWPDEARGTLVEPRNDLGEV